MNRYLSLIRAHRDEINEKDELSPSDPGLFSSFSFISLPDQEEVQQKEVLSEATHDVEIIAPILAVLACQTLPLDAYGIVDGTWLGPGIKTLPIGYCAACGWYGVPLAVVGKDSRCALCWQADERSVGLPARCQTFCERDLLRPSRFEPGGLLACPDCTARMLASKERHAQRTQQR